LPLSLFVLPLQEQIEPPARVFERERHTILSRLQRGLLDGTGEAAGTSAAIPRQRQNAPHYVASVLRVLEPLPRRFTARIDCGRVKLNPIRIFRIKPCGKQV